MTNGNNASMRTSVQITDEQQAKTKSDNLTYLVINLILFVILAIPTLIFFDEKDEEPMIFMVINVGLYALRGIFHSVVMCFPKYSGRHLVVNILLFLIEVAITFYGI